MSRIVVVGYAVGGVAGAIRSVGPARRARQFASAIADAGHETTLLWVYATPRDARDCGIDRRRGVSARFREREILEADFVNGRGAFHFAEARADAVVAATVHAASIVARREIGDLPLWVDVFGDPMAEAQAKAATDGSDLALVRYWGSLACALERGDHFSAVSNAQSHALVGQLGMSGRLTGAAAGHDLVSVIPCAAEASSPVSTSLAATDPFPSDAFVVLFGGSFNTWCDIPTMLAGVEYAMDAESSIRLVVTGGAVPGHDERTYRDFLDRVSRSRHRSRVHVKGWVDDAELAALYARADVGANVERLLYERSLGAENRVVDWMVHGIPAVTTGLSEMGHRSVEMGLAFGVPGRDPRTIGRTLVDLARDRGRVRSVAQRCREYGERYLSAASTARPLVEWCDRPARCSFTGDSRLRIALASDPRHLAGLLESYLDELGLAEIGFRSVRWMWRRVSRGRRRTRTGA